MLLLFLLLLLLLMLPLSTLPLLLPRLLMSLFCISHGQSCLFTHRAHPEALRDAAQQLCCATAALLSSTAVQHVQPAAAAAAKFVVHGMLRAIRGSRAYLTCADDTIVQHLFRGLPANYLDCLQYFWIVCII
jgi:hypothetical protein